MSTEKVSEINKKLAEILDGVDPPVAMASMLTRIVLLGIYNGKTREQYLDIVTDAWDEISNMMDIMRIKIQKY